MSEQTQDVVTKLEQRVEALTRANRELRRQAPFLDATVKIIQAALSAPDISTLNKRMARVTKNLFDLHHVGIYLIDSSGKWIVLSAAAGKESRKMNREGLRFSVDDELCISWVSQSHKPYLSYPSKLTGGQNRAFSIQNRLLAKAQSELTLPLMTEAEVVGVLDLQSPKREAYSRDDVVLLQALADRIALAISKAQQYARAVAERDRSELLSALGSSFGPDVEIDTILQLAVNLTGQLGASWGEAKLLAGDDQAYFRSSDPKQTGNGVDSLEAVRSALDAGSAAQALKTKRPVLIVNTSESETLQTGSQHTGSGIYAPVIDKQNRFRGTIAFFDAKPFHFSEADLPFMAGLASQIAVALDRYLFISEIRNSLSETKLMLDISRSLSGADSLNEVYEALETSVLACGADRCTLYMCDALDNNNLPTYGQIVFAGDSTMPAKAKLLNFRFPLAKYEILDELVYTQEALVIDDVTADERLSSPELELFRQFDSRSLIINPLVSRAHVIGFLSIEHQQQHQFTERELALYRTLCKQTTVALEHARRIQRTKEALAETQTLYRAGRVLAGAEDLQAILEEALIEFVYSFGLDQGGITLLTADRQFGQLRAYMEKGQLQDFEKLRFPIREDIVYQQLLFSGQPFTSYDVANDIRLAEFRSFNKERSIRSTLQAPMIIRGETIGWIGVDAVNEHREFIQKDTDLSRAMADQIAIAIQNHRLLEQTGRRAEQLKAVATVGEAVTGLLELDEVLKITVDLIRDRFGFYHVSIFLLDDRQQWAVVRASTGEVGKIMVERPHRLGVGSNSIVGFVTANATPRIALDVGQDAVHFNNPLLPDTRSEMALPLLARGIVIGALDVQSEKPHAFTNDDVETLQIMADQVTSAIENARLFEQTQRRLKEQAMLYSIGTKISGTLKLQETTDILVTETAEALNCAQCVLSLLDEDQAVHILSDYVRKGSNLGRELGSRLDVQSSESWSRILADRQEFILHIDEATDEGWETAYLKEHDGTALVITPILLRNEVIGTLEVYDDQPGRRFKHQDVTLLDSIALLAANAIENARLYESIHESQAFMKAIIDQIPDPIFIKDRDHKWVVINTAFAEGILGQPEDKILGASDHDFLPEKQADWFWEYDNKMFETDLIQETEESITDFEGNLRTLYTRRIPLNLSPDKDKPDYLIGIINDITDRKQREAERERLIKETRKTLDRTQTLYRISNLLAAADEQQATFEAVLVEYLKLLRLKQGRIMLHDKALNANVARARVTKGKAVSPSVIIAADEDRVFQQLLKDPTSIQVSHPKKHRLTKGRPDLRGRARIASMLFVPLVIRKQLLGTIIVDATDADYEFDRSDIKTGESIADQLTIWLENRRLLTEAQYRSDLLQTAAGVSRAASSILDVETLINTSVNLIRDQFDFYYVGLFLVDEAREWAVLQAGTGEAGRIQLDKNHQLEVGGESMIGWSIKHRQARIALDVGEEAVHFKNPILPETHSEMALPLKSRDEVIGALTVQSVERGAFSDEDIVLLQTMADQLANAIKNAYLFTQAQEVLAETEVLYQVTQKLSLARDEGKIYQVAIEAISQSDVDSSAIYMYLDSADQADASLPEQIVEQKEVWTRSGTPAIPNGTRFRAADFALEQLVPQHGWHLIDDVNDDENISEQMHEALTSIGITSLLILPLSTYQRQLGFLVAAYKSSERRFSQKQIRFHTAIAQQLVTALENLRLLDASQRRARREEVIREITLKIRNAVDVDDILKTTVVELGKVLGASRGNITLGVERLAAPAQTQSRRGNGTRKSKPQDDSVSDNPAKNDDSVG